MLFVAIMSAAGYAQRDDETPYLQSSVNLIEPDVFAKGSESRSEFHSVLFHHGVTIIARIDIFAIPRRNVANQPISLPQGSEAELIKSGARHTRRIANDIPA